MNDLTIIFFEQLAERVNPVGPLLERLRRELLADAKERLKRLLLPSTAYLSPRGRAFAAGMDSFMRRASAVREIAEVRPLFRQLVKLETEAEDLHQETCAALSSPGKLDPDRIHIVFHEEAGEGRDRLLSAIRLEMYRLMTASSGKAIANLPRLYYVHPDLESYYQYYARSVLPAFSLMERRSRFGVWAFQYKEQTKLGAMVRLPVYVQAAPRAEKTRLLPGEHRLTGTGVNEMWQGMGAITNVTPASIQQAQKDGIHFAVTSEMLCACRLTGTPTQILDQCFGGQWYAVDPAHFFSALSAALCARALKLRASRGQCLYCGADGAGAALCLSCVSKVRQKI